MVIFQIGALLITEQRLFPKNALFVWTMYTWSLFNKANTTMENSNRVTITL